MISLPRAVLVAAHPKYYHNETLKQCIEVLADQPELLAVIQQVIDQRQAKTLDSLDGDIPQK